MPDNNSSSTQLYAQALREALDSVVAPDVRDEVIETALNFAELESPPADQAAFFSFVSGPVRITLEQIVGRRTALLAIEELHRLLGVHDDFADGSSEIRRISELSMPAGRSGSSGPIKRDVKGARVSRPDQDAPRRTLPVPDGLPPSVFIATTDVHMAKALASQLQGIASVQAIDDLLTLMEEIRSADQRALIVIIDGRMPTISVATIATLGPELPEHAHVLLWRADDTTKQQAQAVSEKSRDWLRIPEQHSLDEIAALCQSLLSDT